MERRKARAFFRIAWKFMIDNFSEELEDVRDVSPEKFRKMNVRDFLAEYCWVVYVAGFSERVLREKFDDLEKAFKNFDIEKLCKMRSLKEVLSIFNNEKKARNFLKGVKQIHEEGFSNFKKRVLKEGMKVLKELPGIGKVTQKHLARNIGILDVSKDDIWLRRLSEKLKARNVEELTEFLAKEFNEKRGVVDIILWRFCAEKAWKEYGFNTLDDFIKSL